MIRGYVEQPSPRPGGRLVLRVSTDAPRFRVEIYRCGAQMLRCGGTSWLDGELVPPHLPFHDWGEVGTGLHGEPLAPWPAYDLPVPGDWTSGVHVALLVEGDEHGRELSHPDPTTPDGRDARVLFAVRPPAAGPTAPVLYKLPLLTWFAYALADGEPYDPVRERGHWCLYNMPRPQEVPRPFPTTVSVHRPGGGTGAWPYDAFNVDPYDATPRQTFVHWDAPMLGWLEREGYGVDVCTDVDLHREGEALLAPYPVLLSAGHDEYWSPQMRDAVESFVSRGGNAAFFGGNTSWWQVEFADDVTFSRKQFWHEAGRPENAMIGVSFRNGGERDGHEHPVGVGYRVQHADHWVYEGTGLRDGDVFGADEHLVGYECDGAAFDRADLATGRAVLPTGKDGTPEGFVVLGVGDVTGWGFGNAAATMGVLTCGGTVFNGATTDWPRVLTTSPVVQQITRNVLSRLSSGQAGG